jgi:hypothetical protein
MSNSFGFGESTLVSCLAGWRIDLVLDFRPINLGRALRLPNARGGNGRAGPPLTPAAHSNVRVQVELEQLLVLQDPGPTNSPSRSRIKERAAGAQGTRSRPRLPANLKQ